MESPHRYLKWNGVRQLLKEIINQGREPADVSVGSKSKQGKAEPILGRCDAIRQHTGLMTMNTLSIPSMRTLCTIYPDCDHAGLSMQGSNGISHDTISARLNTGSVTIPSVQGSGNSIRRTVAGTPSATILLQYQYSQ